MKPHQFTHTGERVLIVKCLNADGTGYGGFVWPKAGPVKNSHWSRKADCESGGLFGWPWGMGIGDGKDPNACSPWLVYSAKPENVIGEIESGTKCKAVPGEDGDVPQVVYFGTMAGAIKFTHEGRQAFIVGNSSSAASSGDSSSAASSGYRSSAASSGYRSSAASSGYSSSAASSGDRSSAASSGDSSSAASSGYSSSAASSGDRSSAASSGDRSSAASSGYSSSAASSGDRSSAASSGYSSSAASSGYSSSAASSGDRSSAASSGDSSSAASSGDSSSAASSGDRSSAASSGDRSVAVITGEFSSIECGAMAIGAVTANRFFWKVRVGAVLLCQWTVSEKYSTRTLDAKKLKLKEGATVKVEFGKIVKEFSL